MAILTIAITKTESPHLNLILIYRAGKFTDPLLRGTLSQTHIHPHLLPPSYDSIIFNTMQAVYCFFDIIV
jgi:hypothetical protein